jgi:hypothetical protein
MKGRLSLAVPVAMAVCAVASASSAEVEPRQMAGGRQPRQIVIFAEAKVDHDTNVARLGQRLATEQRIIPDDTIYSPSSNVDIVLPVGRQALFLKGYGSYLFHDANKRLDRSEADLSGGIGNSIGRCGSVLGGTYRRGLSQIEDRALVQNVQNILTSRRVSFGLTCLTPSGLGMLSSVSRDWGDNSLTQLRENDSVTSAATLGVVVGRPSTGVGTVFGGYSETKYQNRTSSTGGQDGYEVINGGVRLERKLGGRINAEASVSYSRLSLKAPPIVRPGAPADVGTEFSGWTYSAGLTFRASSRLETALTLDRKISPTIVSGRAYEIQTNYNGRIDYRIGSRIRTSLTLVQSRIATRGGVPTGAQILTDSRTRSGTLAVEYRQSERVSLRLSGTREERQADNTDFDYGSDRVGIALSVKY